MAPRLGSGFWILQRTSTDEGSTPALRLRGLEPDPRGEANEPDLAAHHRVPGTTASNTPPEGPEGSQMILPRDGRTA
ncbi:hypothetical protein Cob_v010107 [Colletotrichum orbiculare MAFF 240422]|uniref:Uncharacterized protein n=1 Tax=Colletotrichum orbiculare (strain 104-T / ATCC 96160 / CBS 514.97 / LARS 414 / MAFF 240422) TaxID=1213857 RepID=A0A484FGY5_COLOR|nr:hypothetical protein Cob_v010107 [Colletotrichum orbiculare MAFF 240422]